MVGLLGDPNDALAGLAAYFAGEQVNGPEVQRAPREAQRTAMAGLLGVAQGIAATGALSPSYSPVRPGFAEVLTGALSGGLQGGQAGELYNFQAQQLALQQAQQARELGRRQNLRALLGSIALQGQQQPQAAPAPAPAADAWPAEGGPAGPGLALPASLDADTVGQLPGLAALQPDIQTIFRQAVLDAGLSPEAANVYARMVFRESGGRHTRQDGSVITSPRGARGVAQMMPATFAEVANARGIEGSIDDPVANLRAGAWYFRQMLDEFGGDTMRAAGAYNAGPGRMRQVLQQRAQLPAETRAYLAAVTGPPAGAAEPAVTALASAANIPRPVAQNLLGLTPQDAMLLLMLPDAEAAKAIGEILKQRAGGGGYELISPADAAALGLPSPDTTRYQRQTGGESRGRISEVGGGGTRVTIEQRGQDRLQQLDIETLGRARQAAEAGEQITPQLRIMRDQLVQGGLETGPMATARAAVGNYLAGVGALGRDQLAQLNNARLFQALVATIVPQMRPVGSGSTSDRDLALFQQAAPQMLNTEAGNLLIAGAMLQIREAQARQVQQMEDYLRTQGGSLAGYADFARRNPIVAFPRLPEDLNRGREMLRGMAPGTVVVLPNGRLGVLVADGSIDEGDGPCRAAARRAQGGR